MKIRNPRTPTEWQDAVNGAEACLLIDSARQYGLIVGGPRVNVDRCVALLEHGRARKIVPTQDGVDRVIAAMAADGFTGNVSANPVPATSPTVGEP